MVGINPDPFSLRQLLTMQRGKQESAWAQTATLLALIYNAHCATKGRTLSPNDFNPFAIKAPAAKVILDRAASVAALTALTRSRG